MTSKRYKTRESKIQRRDEGEREAVCMGLRVLSQICSAHCADCQPAVINSLMPSNDSEQV